MNSPKCAVCSTGGGAIPSGGGAGDSERGRGRHPRLAVASYATLDLEDSVTTSGGERGGSSMVVEVVSSCPEDEVGPEQAAKPPMFAPPAGPGPSVTQK